MSNWLKANWPAPSWLYAGSSFRTGGVSQSPYSSFNLATHVDDKAEEVTQNRNKLRAMLDLPAEPYWLNQIHSDVIVEANTTKPSIDCDGAYTEQNGMVVAVLTADCLPLLLCDTKHRRIAAIHVGWRGYSKGIVHRAIELFSLAPLDTMAWLGPCISREHYEVDSTVRDACLGLAPHLEHAFTANRAGHWLFDLRQLVTDTLNINGISTIYNSGCCTYAEADRWYSYRREGTTGRIASLIWMDNT